MYIEDMNFTLKMEATFFSETFVNTPKSTWSATLIPQW
jgi:hypothetical protein